MHFGFRLDGTLFSEYFSDYMAKELTHYDISIRQVVSDSFNKWLIWEWDSFVYQLYLNGKYTRNIPFCSVLVTFIT